MKNLGAVLLALVLIAGLVVAVIVAGNKTVTQTVTQTVTPTATETLTQTVTQTTTQTATQTQTQTVTSTVTVTPPSPFITAEWHSSQPPFVIGGSIWIDRVGFGEDVVYATRVSPAKEWVFKSEDDGKTWKETEDVLPEAKYQLSEDEKLSLDNKIYSEFGVNAGGGDAFVTAVDENNEKTILIICQNLVDVEVGRPPALELSLFLSFDRGQSLFVLIPSPPQWNNGGVYSAALISRNNGDLYVYLGLNNGDVQWTILESKDLPE